MEFTILGPTELRIKGRSIPLGAAKQRGLLAVLLYHAGDPVRVEAIVELLWPNRDAEACRTLLYTLASRLRAALRAAGVLDALERVPGTGAYRLDVEPAMVDYHRFRRLTAQARYAASRNQHDHCVALLTTALELWRNDPLPELRGARGEHLRRDMREQLLAAEKLLAGSDLASGRYDRVLARLEPLIADNQFDEVLARLQVAALHGVGRIHDAREFVVAFSRRYRRKMRTDPDLEMTKAPARLPVASHGSSASIAETIPVPRQLPHDVPDFTGHDGLLSEMDRLATDSGTGNVIALTGMPGVGKTAFATRWGHARSGWFPEGELYLNAEAHSRVPPVQPDDALRRFLVGLGVAADRIPDDATQRRELYHRLLDGRRVLVVLDNILDSDQARQLIPRSATTLTIVISRNRLSGLSVRHGVRSLTITPLPQPDRTSLLARIVGSERAEARPAALHTLGRLSGGLPIALRIIGEHLASQPNAALDDLADELGDRLFDIDGDDSDEFTLRTVFAWSVDSLAPLPARLFWSLGLFPGTTIGVEAAAALLDSELVAAEQALDRLARAHLINHESRGRYRIHDLLHRYATDRDRTDGPSAVRRAALNRLFDWYVLTATNAVRWLEPQRPAVPDLPEPVSVRPMEFREDAAALRWCEAERANLASVVRAAAREGFFRHAWQIVNELHEVYDRSGPQNELRDMLQVALDAAVADGHLLGQAGTLANLGAVSFAGHDYERADDIFTRALSLAKQGGFADIQLICLHNLASVHLRTGRIPAAVEVFRQVLHACREAGNLNGEASTLTHLGDAHRQLRQFDDARRLYREALAVSERSGSLRGRSLNHVRLAEVSALTERPEAALAQTQVPLDLHGRVNDDVIRCDALIIRSEAWLRLGRHRDALADATVARALGEELADPLRQARALAVLVAALLASGDRPAAQARGREALDVLDHAGQRDQATLRSRLLTILAADGDARDGPPDIPEAPADAGA
ncbi:tetratricopeptide repeat protein [Plantactinospora sp. KBS50]|uniref:AfsR/SARP family transcriptional regulator n=1 Tax=Plantactinospora sp. KBS50 TaxID=2024580 RepID=UPI0018DEF0ED|nr:tetratricopeptide repeat protein [Plantactinospora sp. KBS50]